MWQRCQQLDWYHCQMYMGHWKVALSQSKSLIWKLTWAQGPNGEFHRNMFHIREQLQRKHRWIDLSNKREYFSIYIYLWYKEQQWLQDWDDHQIGWLHWKYQSQHRKQRRDKDPSNYLFLGRIVRRRLELKFNFYSYFRLQEVRRLEISYFNLPRATLMKIRVPKNSPKMIFTASFILKHFLGFSQVRIFKNKNRGFVLPDVFWVVVN